MGWPSSQASWNVSWGSRSSFRGAGRRLGLRGPRSEASTWNVGSAASPALWQCGGLRPVTRRGFPHALSHPVASPRPPREIMGGSSAEMSRTRSPSPSPAAGPAQAAVPVTGNAGAGVARAEARAGPWRVTPLPSSLDWLRGRRGRERPPPRGTVRARRCLHAPSLMACRVRRPWTRGVPVQPGRWPRGPAGGRAQGAWTPSARPTPSAPASAHPGAPAPDPAIARVSACTVTGSHGRSGARGGGPPTPPSVHPGSLGPSLLRGRQSGPSGDLVPVDTPGWSQPLSSKQACPESARGHGARIGLRLQVLHRRFRKGISHRL